MNRFLYLAIILITAVSIANSSDFLSYGNEYVRLVQLYKKENDANKKQGHFDSAKEIAMILFGIPHGARLVIGPHIDALCKSLSDKGQELEDASKSATGKEALKKKRESEHFLRISKFLGATAKILEAMSIDLSLLDKLMIKSPESVIPLAKEIVVMLRVLKSFFKDKDDLDSVVAIVTEFATSGLEGTRLLSLPLSVVMSLEADFDFAAVIESTDFLDKTQCKYLN
jgi:hypothetical protein